LRSSLKTIVEQVEVAAPTIVTMLEEQDRRDVIERREREAARQRWLREEDCRRIALSIADSNKDLRDVIERWSDVMRIEQFFAGVEARATSLGDASQAAVLERLRLARQFLGSQDPLDFFRDGQTPVERYQPQYADEDDLPNGS
jgi:hypothetical protein